MCNYKSAIVVKTAGGGFDLLHSPLVNSHEDLVMLFKLKDTNTVRGEPRFARVEFRPESVDTLDQIDTYKLIVDEPRTPEWLDVAMAKSVSDKLRIICAANIILPAKLVTPDATEHQKPDVDLLVGGPWIIGRGVLVHRVHEFAIVAANLGTVTDNSGTVTDNSGTVTDNSGTVTDNSGTVTDNYSTVTDNSGTVTVNSGTVTDNSGTVTDNYGTVTDNYGTVTVNSGTVTDNSGTVTRKK